MMFFRSILFNVLFFGGGLLLAVLLLPCLLLPRTATQWGLKAWALSMMWFLRVVVGLRWELKGLEHLPDEPCIFACKHQSAWETGFFYLLRRDPAYILKKELLTIPFFGWYVARGGAIAIDRKAGASALKAMVRGARTCLARGQDVVIFPEGTRSALDEPGVYHPGVAALYKGCAVHVVPFAVNSGLFWPRRSFLKRPGCVTIEILPAIAPGLDRKTFMATLECRMEEATKVLVADARMRYPHALAVAPDPCAVENNHGHNGVK